MLVRTATVADVDGMMKLDYEYYPVEWQVELQCVRRTFRKGQDLARVIESDGEIKGYYAFLPLEKEAFEQVLAGEIHEDELSRYVLDYHSAPKEVFLYMVSIIVDIKDEHRKTYTKTLIQDMPGFLRSIEQKGALIKELGAIVVSAAGKRIAERIGYQHHGQVLQYTGKKYPIYRAQLRDIERSIKVEED